MNQATKAHVRARTRRWVALVGGLWILSSGGLSYNFAIYSSQLKVPSRIPNASLFFLKRSMHLQKEKNWRLIPRSKTPKMRRSISEILSNCK